MTQTSFRLPCQTGLERRILRAHCDSGRLASADYQSSRPSTKARPRRRRMSETDQIAPRPLQRYRRANRAALDLS